MARLSTNSYGRFVVTFPALYVYFVYIKHAYFITFIKIHFGMIGSSFEKTCVG
jgi:hypothetical protein